MFRLSRTIQTNAFRACQTRTLKPTQARWFTHIKPLQTSKIIPTLAVTTTTLAAPLLFKQPVHCQAAFVEPPVMQESPILKQTDKSVFNRNELTFGTFLGLCTGFLVKKVGKIFAGCVGLGFVFLQYLSHEGYVTVHWDRLQGRYTNSLDLDKDGRVTRGDLNSTWQKFVNFLTNNIQFKSTFLIGFYAGLRYG
ncbi:FUN14 domain-containing protein 1 [Choanephora cucurbitarum]|uniref:FUN14 domain-containing protein 1 n=1 Tax=Choanephora cucurbitarum TaxID=101091 RepID=A0A1C7NFU3_9FUNG|nr:FUN14 domain-containing protein 1 [Choanephora cucurbitarum]